MTKIKWNDPHLEIKLFARDVIPSQIARIVAESDKTKPLYIFCRSTREIVAAINP